MSPESKDEWLTFLSSGLLEIRDAPLHDTRAWPLYILKGKEHELIPREATPDEENQSVSVSLHQYSIYIHVASGESHKFVKIQG